jgi:integrase
MWKQTRYPGVRYREHPTRRHIGRADRYFAIRYYGSDGKRHEEALGWSSDGWTAEQAARELANIRANVRRGEGPASLSEKRMLHEAAVRARIERDEAERAACVTLAEVQIRYAAWAKLNKRSWRGDDSRLRTHILPALGHFPLRDIGAARVEALKNSLMARGLAAATVRQVIGLIRRIFNFAAATQRSETVQTPIFQGPNPCATVHLPQQDNSRLNFFNRKQAELILEHAKDFPKQRRHGRLDFHDICLLSLMTGMRRGEIQSLEWQDVDMTHALIHIRDAKSGDGIAHMNSDVLEMMRRRRDADCVGRVFKGVLRGGKVGISHTFAELLDDLGLNYGVSDPRQRFCFHSLRHTFASWLALQGTDIYRIKELMRHKTIGQTMRYAHLIPGATQEAVEGLTRRPAGPTPPASESPSTA